MDTTSLPESLMITGVWFFKRWLGCTVSLTAKTCTSTICGRSYLICASHLFSSWSSLWRVKERRGKNDIHKSIIFCENGLGIFKLGPIISTDTLNAVIYDIFVTKVPSFALLQYVWRSVDAVVFLIGRVSSDMFLCTAVVRSNQLNLLSAIVTRHGHAVNV